jgi:hypothetical protein
MFVRTRPARLSLALVVGIALALGGCSDSGGDGGGGAKFDLAKCQLCEPGTVICKGNWSVTCGADGKSVETVACPASQACEAASGTCQPQSDCTPGTPGCAGGDGEATTCTPGQRLCADPDGDGITEAVLVCNAEGSGNDPSLTEDCTDVYGYCEAGFCRCGEPAAPGEGGEGGDSIAVDGADDPDAGDGEGGGDDTIVIDLDVPPLEKPDIASASIDGETVDFDSFASANWIAAGEDAQGFGVLQILMAAGQRQVELQVSPTPIGWTGNVNADAGGDIGGFIGFNDGTTGPETDFKYGAGFSSKGGAYGGNFDITINENGGPGGRVTGTFFGMLNLAAGDGPQQIEIIEGSFDVAHK